MSSRPRTFRREITRASPGLQGRPDPRFADGKYAPPFVHYGSDNPAINKKLPTGLVGLRPRPQLPSQHTIRSRVKPVGPSPLSPTPGNATMDVSQFIHGNRESAFLVGDHATYRAQLSRRLRTVRKKLGRATAKNAKYAAKAPVTAGDIGKDHE